MTTQAQVTRAHAIVAALMGRALDAFTAGDLGACYRLEARAARVELFADRLGW